VGGIADLYNDTLFICVSGSFEGINLVPFELSERRQQAGIPPVLSAEVNDEHDYSRPPLL
jgi:hypothetical protein